MYKKIAFWLLFLGFFSVSQVSSAQFDCDCEWVDEPVCVTDDDGFSYTLPNACFAECLGYSDYVDGPCEIEEEEEWEEWEDTFGDIDIDEFLDDLFGWDWSDCDWDEFDWEDEWYDEESDGDWEDEFGEWWSEDCDCEVLEDEAWVCATDEFGWIFEFPNACVAECLGFFVVDCESDEEEGEEWDCDCDDEDDFACFVGEDGVVFEFCACLGELFGFEYADCDDLEDGEWDDEWEDEWECDCEILEDEPWVCAVDEWGWLYEFPNACIAECEGFEVVECDFDWEEEEWEDEWDCDCEPDFIPVCVMDPMTGEVFDFFDACIAECEGLVVVDCEEGDWEEEEEWEDEWDCDCEPDFIPVCVMDPMTGDVFDFFDACIAECEGLVVVDCEEGDWEEEEEWEDEWDCDCEPDFIPVCVMDPMTGDVFDFFDACIAECEGLVVVDCEEGDWEEEEEWEGEWDCDCEPDFIPVCVIDPETGDIFIHFDACIAECEGFEVVECEEFDPLEEDYDEDLELAPVFMDESSLIAFPNPTYDKINLEWSLSEEGMVSIDVYDINGRRVLMENITSEKGYSLNTIDLDKLENGIYMIQVSIGESTEMIRVVKN